MSRTRRRNWKGEPIRDGHHGKHCPERNCERCVNGAAKRPWRRRFRHNHHD